MPENQNESSDLLAIASEIPEGYATAKSTLPEQVKLMAEGLRVLSETRAVALAMREWIDAVPDDTPLPAMPGFDRDWADEILFGITPR